MASILINGREDVFYCWLLNHMAVDPVDAFSEADLQHYVEVNTDPKLTHATYQYYKSDREK